MYVSSYIPTSIQYSCVHGCRGLHWVLEGGRKLKSTCIACDCMLHELVHVHVCVHELTASSNTVTQLRGHTSLYSDA